MARLMSQHEGRELFLSGFSRLEISDLRDFLASVMSPHLLEPFPSLATFKHLQRLLFGTEEIPVKYLTQGARWDLHPIIKETPRIKALVAEWVSRRAAIARENKLEQEFLQSIKLRFQEPKKEQVVNAPLKISRDVRVAVFTKKPARAEDRKELKEKLTKELLVPPGNLFISRPQVGEIWVTRHAWERFVARYCSITKLGKAHFYDKAYFVRHLQRCFTAAEEKDLSNKGKMMRMFANSLKPTRYFYYQPLNLRFVVLVERPILLTVEIARYW